MRELFVDQTVDPIPVGAIADDLVVANRIVGIDPSTGAMPETIGAQLENCYSAMERCLTNVGGGLENVAHVSMFFADIARDKTAMNPPWLAAFRDDSDRPTYKFMPARLPPGVLVQMEFHAVLGQRRELLAVQGVTHTNPIPLGVTMGPYLFSSRMLPYDPGTGSAAEGADAQARFLFQNCDALLEAGGFDWSEVWQARAFLADDVHRSLFDREWNARFPASASGPAVSYVQYGGGALQVMAEIFARKE